MKEKMPNQDPNNEYSVPHAFVEAFPNGFNPNESLSSQEDFDKLFAQINKTFAARIRRRLFFESLC